MNLKPGHNLRWLLLTLALIFVYFTALNGGSIMRADDPLGEEPVIGSPDIKKFSNAELRKLVAPIALYPDALLAQVLQASAYPLQVVAAYRHVQASANPTQPPAHVIWDSSVVALLNYSTVLKKMNDDLDWTERMGVAVTYQMNEVSDTIQQVRAEAQAAGNLVSNDKQKVIRETDVIRVVPADPTVIYVPTYEPDVIFIAHDNWTPYISFGIGFGVGVWLDNDWDWYHHHFWRRHLWYSGGWYQPVNPIFWSAPYRPVPGWYRRDGSRAPVTGYRSGTVAPNTPHIRSTPATPSTQPTRRTQGAAESLGSTGQDVRREANRGQTSRNNVPSTPRTPRAPVASTRSYSPPTSNVMRPSDGRSTHVESSRGAASRGGTGGGRRR